MVNLLRDNRSLRLIMSGES